MNRASLALFFTFFACVLPCASAVRADELDDLRQEATTALSRLANQHRRPEYWDSHAYWVHYLDKVLELKKAGNVNAAERLAQAERTLRQTGVRVEVAPDDLVRVSPEPPSYSDRALALKSAAAASIYSRLTHPSQAQPQTH